MVRSAVAFAFVVVSWRALGLSREPGCGGADSPSSGPNAPCTRSKDCSTGLVCAEGVCSDPDSGAAAPADGGRDATSNADASDDGG